MQKLSIKNIKRLSDSQLQIITGGNGVVIITTKKGAPGGSNLFVKP